MLFIVRKVDSESLNADKGRGKDDVSNVSLKAIFGIC